MYKNFHNKPGIIVHPLIQAFERKRQVSLCEFKDTQWDLVSKKANKQASKQKKRMCANNLNVHWNQKRQTPEMLEMVVSYHTDSENQTQVF